MRSFLVPGGRKQSCWPYLVCLALVGAWAYQLGQRLLAEHLAAEAGIVASENRVFCNSFGLAETSNEFARCATGLDNIRQKQRERLETATIGLL